MQSEQTAYGEMDLHGFNSMFAWVAVLVTCLVFYWRKRSHHV